MAHSEWLTEIHMLTVSTGRVEPPSSAALVWETDLKKVFMSVLVRLLDNHTSLLKNIVVEPTTASRHKLIVPKERSSWHPFSYGFMPFFGEVSFNAAWEAQSSWSC